MRRNRLTERDLSRIVKRVIIEQEDENTDELNNELLDYFQGEIDTMRKNISVHKPDTIAGVLRERANDFLNRSQFVEDFSDTEKWGKSKN
jgi:hypothetical protein